MHPMACLLHELGWYFHWRGLVRAFKRTAVGVPTLSGSSCVGSHSPLKALSLPLIPHQANSQAASHVRPQKASNKLSKGNLLTETCRLLFHVKIIGLNIVFKRKSLNLAVEPSF
eukprot:jgi/Mesvir1/27546/Mv07301-RA.1